MNRKEAMAEMVSSGLPFESKPPYKYKPLLTLRSSNGAMLTSSSDSNREEPDYLQWSIPFGNAYGVVANTPETRRFLEDTLRRFRRDASRLKQRAKKAGKQ
jgi:hypothetical protein